jgi:hypothetical protein
MAVISKEAPDNAPSSAPSPPQQQLSPLGHAVAGALGALFSLTVTYPLDM